MHLARVVVPLVFSVLVQNPAYADWVKNVQVDDFSDEEVIIIENIGEVVSGPQGRTSLVYRKTGNLEEIFWKTPDSYICDNNWNVQMRLNNGEPKTAMVSSSTSNTSVFFSRFDRVFIDFLKSDEIKLLLEDGCGTRLVAAFEGNALEYFPDISEFEKLPNWSFNPKLGSIETSNKNVMFTYRTIVTGDHDMSLKISDPNLSGKKISKGTIKFSGNEYKASVYDDDISTGEFKVFFKDKNIVDTFVKKLKGETTVAIELKDQTYELVISDFELARKMVK